MKIAFVGGGNMASALVGGLLKTGAAPADIVVVDISPEARARVAQSFGVRVAEMPGHAALSAADVVVIAVKPQQMREVATAIAPAVGARLVVSVAAGIRTGDLSRWLGGHARVIRVMPNTPALIGQGVSVLFAARGASDEDRRAAEGILAAVGPTLWCSSERMVDAATAVSGSGPAYVFYAIEALEQAARQLGFSSEEARTLTYQTFAGAVALAQASPDEPAVLRARVTSKGGTTQAALESMEADRVRENFVKGVLASDARARELGEILGRDDSPA